MGLAGGGFPDGNRSPNLHPWELPLLNPKNPNGWCLTLHFQVRLFLQDLIHGGCRGGVPGAGLSPVSDTWM